MTVLDHLLSTFHKAGVYNRHDLAKPSVILWTDGQRSWEKVAPLIARSRGGFFQLQAGEVEDFKGPSTWIRYQLGKWSGEEIPVVYLPGIHRHQFRGAAGFPEEARHLYALQFKGQFCSQLNGKDWTPMALLSSESGGLGLKVGKDAATQEALAEQLTVILQTPVAELSSRHLEASDFHELAAGDPVRLLLDWMGDPEDTKGSWPSGQWSALVGYSKKELGFDPEKDGLITGAEKLTGAEGRWAKVWKRFEEAAVSFPGVRKALELVQPTDLFTGSNPRIPATNRRMEDDLRKALLKLGDQNASAARDALEKLVSEHVKRASSVWGKLDEAPLATSCCHLGGMLAAMKSGMAGSDLEGLGASYLSHGWHVDAEARRAWAVVRTAEDTAALTAVLRAVYLPWLEQLAERIQASAANYPVAGPAQAPRHEPQPGMVVLFVDGFRADLAMELAMELGASGFQVETRETWSALPTVTATAKPAWEPLAGHLDGQQPSEGYEPTLRVTGKLCGTSEFRKLTTEVGWTWFDAAQVGDPSGSGWTEVGTFDRYGHDQGAKLAWRIREEMAAIRQRVDGLFAAGWKKIRIVTDHGWLWMPGGLPKVDLPTHLTDSKWGRCARPNPQASQSLLQVPWFWGNEHAVVLAPGIGVFKNGVEYTHGGLSLQEALTLSIDVTRDAKAAATGVKITDTKWLGLKLRVEVSESHPDLRADIRAKAADPGSSILKGDPSQSAKAPDPEGRLTLFVEDDSNIGQAAILVILRDGQVIAKRNITIGEN